MKEIIKNIAIGVGIIVGGGFAIYAFFGFMDFLYSDPFDWVDTPQPYVYSNWDRCVNDAKKVFDQFNDTVGANYALGDQPSIEVQNFMNQCLEERAKTNPL